MITIMAVAMTFVIGAAQIDLSVGAITALASLACALILQATDNIFLALIGAIGLGAAVGRAERVFGNKIPHPGISCYIGHHEYYKGYGNVAYDTGRCSGFKQDVFICFWHR